MARILAVTAGGKASRLGGIEKLNLDFSGKSLLDHILSWYLSLNFFDRAVVLSGLKDHSLFKTSYQVEFVADIVEDGGPLIALYSLLLETGNKDEIFLHGGDMPFTSPELMNVLYEHFKEGYDVAVPESSSGVEPLFGWYRSTVKSEVEKVVGEGKKRMISFFETVKVFYLKVPELKKYCKPDLFFFNINTEEDYKKALFLLESICEKKDQDL